ncbi:MAG TPA: cation:proton antiporter [Candidatus Limiplasma stercoravium]|nr:cation:proton antiporter [Candidatus Limiplasma stercoravium]
MIRDLIRSVMVGNGVATVILSIALMLFLGFAMTRITKRLRLPDVTAYILTGILIGPFCMNLIPQQVIDGMDFLSDIALAFIAFSTGEFFTLSTLKKNGMKVVVITVLEACLATVAVFVVTYFALGVDLVFSIVLSALACATAPASTMMTIRQTGAHGDFVDTLLQVVALDDVVGLLEYSIAISLALAVSSGSSQLGISGVVTPIAVNLGVLALGMLFGVLLKLMMPQKRGTDNRLIISVSMLFAFCGICALLGVSPLLGCMSMGTVYINLTHDEKLFKQLNYFTPPILLLFFVRSGLSFQLDALTNTAISVGGASLLTVGGVYFITRIVGKYAGAFVGCALVRKPKRVRNYLGLALTPQAGVAIGLAALGARTLGGDTGVALETVILASSVLYELIGPGCAKLSLYLSKSYSNKLEDLVPAEALDENGRPQTAVELLIQRIQAIQKELPRSPVSDDEQAFLEAAEDQLAAFRSFGITRKRRGS